METTVRIKRKGDCLELDSTSSNSSHDENIGSTTALKTCILCDESTKATENDKPETLTEAFQDIDDEIRSFVDINPSAKLTEKLKNNISHFYHQSCMDDFQRCNSKTTNQCNLQPIPQKQTFQNATSKKIKLQLNAQDSSESDNSLLSNQSQTSILNNFNANSPSLRVKSEPCEERADTSIVSILSPLPEIKDCDDKPDLVKVEVCVEDNPLPVDEEILAKLSHIKPEDYGEEHHQDKGIMEININPQELIALVQERGVLWDKTLNEYKDKQFKISAWREICCLLIPDFDKLDEKEKQTYGKLVSTKWSNLRDAWTRANKNDVKKFEAGVKFAKPYVYKEQMRFLNKVVEPNRTYISVRKSPTDTCPEAPAAKPIDLNSEVSFPSTSKKQKIMNLDKKMSQFLDSRLSTVKDEEHPMLSFFKGVIPSVTSFDDDETLEFQLGVLSLIQKIRKQRENRL